MERKNWSLLAILGIVALIAGIDLITRGLVAWLAGNLSDPWIFLAEFVLVVTAGAIALAIWLRRARQNR